jgi:dinuclear metal center YbgI/SA1388 family protein
MVALNEMVDYANKYLRVTEVGDWDNALNGLQIENSGQVRRIGAAVDVSTRVLNEAIKRKVDLVIVHHGLFWAGLKPVTAGLRRQLKLAFDNDIALYSTHLPLDVHPSVGNNALLAAALGIKSAKPFFEMKGQAVGLRASQKLSREQLIENLQKILGSAVKTFPFGPKTTANIGIITGAAGSEIYEIASHGIDTFITGEAPHWAAVAAEELGINLILGGHYATETFGVRALSEHLAKRFKVPWTFIDCPTGL